VKITRQKFPDVILYEPSIYKDPRGFFMEVWHEEKYYSTPAFEQDNVSYSVKNVIRGLHYQKHYPQGKLVIPLLGTIYDVVVDIRRDSLTFGQYMSIILTDNPPKHLYIPRGYAHGFEVIDELAIVLYKCDNFYNPQENFGIAYDDPQLNIPWITNKPIISDKDIKLPFLKDIPKEKLLRE
jgi:dTDP-4-dehydrorhamnose 3,5-epimerase